MVTIARKAFESCEATKIEIPSCVTGIEFATFANCSSLTNDEFIKAFNAQLQFATEESYVD